MALTAMGKDHRHPCCDLQLRCEVSDARWRAVVTITEVCGVGGTRWTAATRILVRHVWSVHVWPVKVWPVKVRELRCVSKTDGPTDKFRRF